MVSRKKAIYIPPGKYYINLDIYLTGGTRIYGDTFLPTIFKNKNKNIILLKKDDYSNQNNVEICNIFFDNIGIFCKLINTISILNNIFYNPNSLYIVNMETCKYVNIKNNIFMRDIYHAKKNTENRTIYIGGYATESRYEYMENIIIENNLFGLKINELDAIKSFSMALVVKTINQLQYAIESKLIDLEENEQNFFSTGINSYNNLRNTLIKNNFFCQMYENKDRFGVVGDHAIYLRGAQNIQIIGNHLRGLQNGPYGGIKFKSGINITIMNNYLRNTGIIMYETPEYGLGNSYKDGKKCELSNWLVANNIFDFKQWHGNYSIGIEYNKHIGNNNVYNGVFLDNKFLHYNNIPLVYRRNLLISNAYNEGFKGNSTFLSGNSRDDTLDKILYVEFWDDHDYIEMSSDWKSIIDGSVYEKYKLNRIPIRNTLPIGKNISIKLGSFINPSELVENTHDNDDSIYLIKILNPEALINKGKVKIFIEIYYKNQSKIIVTSNVTII